MISEASPTHMARDLVARHSDIGFVRGYILNFFGRAPSREKIEQYRREYLEAEVVSRDRANRAGSDEKRRLQEKRREVERKAAKRYRERNKAA